MPSSLLWEFVLKLYATGDFAPTAIVLQDEHGADVDILLYLFFLAQHGRSVDTTQAARIDRSMRDWREHVVKPVRALRRLLKDGVRPVPLAASDPIRNAVKAIELDCERAQLDALVREFPPASLPAAEASHTALAHGNLHAYAAHLGGLPEVPVAVLLEAFLKIQST